MSSNCAARQYAIGITLRHGYRTFACELRFRFSLYTLEHLCPSSSFAQNARRSFRSEMTTETTKFVALFAKMYSVLLQLTWTTSQIWQKHLLHPFETFGKKCRKIFRELKTRTRMIQVVPTGTLIRTAKNHMMRVVPNGI